MTNYKKQLISVVAASVMVLNLAAPALADTTIEVSGNGSGSTNYTSVAQTNTNTVSQSNTANVTNNVTANANTGNNDANFNTGGDVTVHTGAAQTTANVTNTLNSNAAQVAGCNCGSNTDALIAGNGAFSDNTVSLKDANANVVSQTNEANVANNVNTTAKTGDNKANSNTGGDVLVVSGNAKSDANVKTTANSNAAMIGGGIGAVVTPTASFKILGNGAGSSNWVDGTLSNENVVSQGNEANISNDVNSEAKTGHNDADFNTGGDVVIGSGNAWSGASVDNMVNFNVANVDCGCTFDVLAKIDGNGANPLGEWSNQPDNTILLDLANANVLGQDNLSNLGNDVYANAKTGANDAFSNTGSVTNNDDPAIITGNATNSTDVSNSGNVNTIGGTPFVLPLPGGNSNVTLSFDMQALLAFFGMSMSN